MSGRARHLVLTSISGRGRCDGTDPEACWTLLGCVLRCVPGQGKPHALCNAAPPLCRNATHPVSELCSFSVLQGPRYSSSASAPSPLWLPVRRNCVSGQNGYTARIECQSPRYPTRCERLSSVRPEITLSDCRSHCQTQPRRGLVHPSKDGLRSSLVPNAPVGHDLPSETTPPKLTPRVRPHSNPDQ